MKKKKFFAKFFIFLLLVFLVSGSGYFFLKREPHEVTQLRKAEVAETEEGHQEYYFKQLDKDEKRAYREILEGVRQRKEEFYVTLSADNKVDKVYHAVLKDHQELFWAHNRETIYKTTFKGRDYCIFSPEYSYTEAEIKEISEAMETACREVLSLLPEEAGDYEKAKTVYTYLIDLASYEVSEHDQSIAGIFWKKSAVCAGYAGAAQYLLERLNVPCIYVDGKAVDSEQNHAWNIVEIDGQNYYMDVTNGDQPEFLEGDAAVLEEHKTTLYDYLCPFPKEYEAVYRPSGEFTVPSCSMEDKNFYVLNDACFDRYDWQEIYDFCCMRLDNGAAVLRFKFRTQQEFDKAYKDWIEKNSAEKVAQYYMALYGKKEIEYHYGVLENLKTIYFMF